VLIELPSEDVLKEGKIYLLPMVLRRTACGNSLPQARRPGLPGFPRTHAG
jgi:hypothetical protein